MYRTEQSRLDSFKNWPLNFLKPKDLAAAGFYYTGEIDKVRCYECSTEICRWEIGEDSLSEHKKWNSRCRFLRNILSTDDSLQNKCKVCYDKGIEIAFLLCGHCCCCYQCASNVEQCVICRRDIKLKARVFIS